MTPKRTAALVLAACLIGGTGMIALVQVVGISFTDSAPQAIHLAADGQSVVASSTIGEGDEPSSTSMLQKAAAKATDDVDSDETTSSTSSTSTSSPSTTSTTNPKCTTATTSDDHESSTGDDHESSTGDDYESSAAGGQSVTSEDDHCESTTTTDDNDESTEGASHAPSQASSTSTTLKAEDQGHSGDD